MAPHVRALFFCIAISIAPVLCWVGRTTAGVWGEIGFPLVVVGASAAYAVAGEPSVELGGSDPSRDSGSGRRLVARRKSA